MKPSDAFTYAFAFCQDGQVRHVEPLPARLVQRVCRAAQFQGVRHGFLPGEVSCRAWLAAVGPRRPRGSLKAYFAQTLGVVVQGAGSTFVRELGLHTFFPWSQLIAAVLMEVDCLAADLPYDIQFVVLPDGAKGGGNCTLSSFIIASRTAPGIGKSIPLYPDLDCADDVPILMPTAALVGNVTYCQADPTLERAGVFLGYLSQDPDGDLYVKAPHFCPALHTEAAPTTLRFTRETWEAIHRRRGELGADLQVVGWSHSHPRLAVEERQEVVAHFLSAEDIAIMTAFFDLPHLFTIVVDAEGPADLSRACAVYGWDEAGVGLVRRSLNLYEERQDP